MGRGKTPTAKPAENRYREGDTADDTTHTPEPTAGKSDIPAPRFQPTTSVLLRRRFQDMDTDRTPSAAQPDHRPHDGNDED